MEKSVYSLRNRSKFVCYKDLDSSVVDDSPPQSPQPSTSSGKSAQKQPTTLHKEKKKPPESSRAVEAAPQPFGNTHDLSKPGNDAKARALQCNNKENLPPIAIGQKKKRALYTETLQPALLDRKYIFKIKKL